MLSFLKSCKRPVLSASPAIKNGKSLPRLGEQKAAVSLGHFPEKLAPGHGDPLWGQSRVCLECTRCVCLSFPPFVPLPPSPSSLFCVKSLFCVWVCRPFRAHRLSCGSGTVTVPRGRAGSGAGVQHEAEGQFARRGQSSRDQGSPSAGHPDLPRPQLSRR